ncbi:MAG: cytochrome c [Acidobacteriota bacterium]
MTRCDIASAVKWTGLALGALTALGAAAAAAGAGQAARPPAADLPTFARNVAPIVYGHCAVCHRPGQSAPFPLLSYDDVKKRGELIVRVTARRYMPPWHALAAPGFEAFRDDRRLSDADLATLRAWVDGGMLPGNLSSAPQPPAFPEGWALGRPDVVLTLPRSIDVPADGPDLYRNVVLPLDLPEDKWITAIDFEPSARTVVHHALFFLSPAVDSSGIRADEVLPGLGGGFLGGLGRGRRAGGGGRDGADRGAGGIGGWVPGMTPRFFPDGIAQPLAARTNVVVQLHLHPSGKVEHEQGRLALYFARERPARSLLSVQVPPQFGFAMGIDIPAGQARYAISDSFVLPVDVEAFGARGHAHYLAREMKMTATLPDRSVRGLLWIGDWDFGWQDSYFYSTPFTLPKGTRIDVTITYDNSAANVRNPSTPPKRVKWGLGSFDEMGSMTLLVAAPPAADRNALRRAQNQHFISQFTARLLGRPDEQPPR